MTELNVEVCPYCNRSYVSNYLSLDKKFKPTADLDHFIPKKKYPFFGLNLYNFVPSCQICNQKFKKETDPLIERMIYPYEEEFGENAKFTIDFANKELDEKYDLNVLLGLSDNIYLDIITHCDEDTKKKIKNSIETFKLDKIYSTNHKDYIKDLIRKAIIYNESRIDELYNQYGSLFSSKDEVWSMVLGNYINPNDLGKRPLAKLTKDIMDELGIK